MADVKPLSLRQNTIYNAVGSLAYQGFQWLITVLVVLLSSDYANSGVLAYAMTVGNMFSSIAIYSTRAFRFPIQRISIPSLITLPSAWLQFSLPGLYVSSTPL